jgi:predicted XRE-type DNA-binding protein
MIGTDDPIPALKRQLAELLVERLEGWSQTYAAHLLGIDQPRLSNLRRGRLERFSLEQLIRFVVRVEGTVELQVKWTNRRAYLFKR